jgi:hypothetical protein
VLLLAPAPVRGEAPRPLPDAAAICTAIAAESAAAVLPEAFLARLIWTESRFDALAVSPKGAQGIAQFMPGTAATVGLADPFDPGPAIAAAARHLAGLRAAFGNLGLAAAAYNAGAARVALWLDGTASLPAETRRYVAAVTGQSADRFREPGHTAAVPPLHPSLPFAEACRALPAPRLRDVPPWGVELGRGPTREAAARAFEHLAPGLLPAEGMATPVILRSPRRTPPGFSARLGTGTRAEALDLCRALRRQAVHCLVVPN